MAGLWNDYNENAISSAVDYFAGFLEKPDKSELRQWVEAHVPATEVFTEDMDDGDLIDNEELLDPFPKFAEDFSPVSERWDMFCTVYEEITGDWLQEWGNFDSEVLKDVTKLFRLFVDKPNEEIEEWVMDNINPSWALKYAHDYESEIDIIFSTMGEEPFIEFYEKFAPDTKDWIWCCGLLIDMGADGIEEIDFYEE